MFTYEVIETGKIGAKKLNEYKTMFSLPSAPSDGRAIQINWTAADGALQQSATSYAMIVKIGACWYFAETSGPFGL